MFPINNSNKINMFSGKGQCVRVRKPVLIYRDVHSQERPDRAHLIQNTYFLDRTGPNQDIREIGLFDCQSAGFCMKTLTG